jgi:hypothetical protein
MKTVRVDDSRNNGDSKQNYRCTQHYEVIWASSHRGFEIARHVSFNPCAAALILALAQPLDGNPVLSFGRDIKLLGRFLDSILFVGRFNCAEMFGAVSQNIDAPAGY